MAVGWRVAMAGALYGSEGFFVRPESGPAEHFRTSVHASPLFAGAILGLIRRVDEALGHPDAMDVVDVGAGRGELLAALKPLLPARIRLTGVELRPRPAGLDPAIGWRRDVPEDVVGVLLATEWLDNVPIDVAEVDDNGVARRVLVDRASGEEKLGPVIDAADRFWLARWWPALAHSVPEPSPDPSDTRTQAGERGEVTEQTEAGARGTPDEGGAAGERDTVGAHAAAGERGTAGGHAVAGERAEIGWPRDVAWADAVSRVRRGCALAVDYGHLREARPQLGTLTGFRVGRQVLPIPDGNCDVTAHVAMDAVASAAGRAYTLVSQREALKALGIDGGRPPIDLAHSDPAGYLRALSSAGAAGELIDPAGLGGHWWLLHRISIGPILS
jgi:SAM-dependent MidA family methyltransferase